MNDCSPPTNGQEMPTRVRQEASVGRRIVGKGSLSEAQGRPVTGAMFDQLAAALEQKARRFPLRATGRPVASQLAYTAEGPSLPNSPTQRKEPGGHAALFIKHHTAPVWSPSQHEDAMVMQQTSREAWRLFKTSREAWNSCSLFSGFAHIPSPYEGARGRIWPEEERCV